MEHKNTAILAEKGRKNNHAKFNWINTGVKENIFFSILARATIL